MRGEACGRWARPRGRAAPGRCRAGACSRCSRATRPSYGSPGRPAAARPRSRRAGSTTPGIAFALVPARRGDADVATFFYYLSLRRPRRRRRAAAAAHPGIPGERGRFHAPLLRALIRATEGAVRHWCSTGTTQVPASSQLHEVLRIALETLPPGGRVVVVSRGDPPAALARLRANQTLAVIGWDELRLTREEIAAIAAKRRPDFGAEAIDALYARTHGWAAGLVLMLEQAHLGRSAEAPGLRRASSSSTTWRARSSRSPTRARSSSSCIPPTCRK